MARSPLDSLARVVVNSVLRGTVYKFLRPLGKTGSVVVCAVVVVLYLVLRG